MPSKPAPHKAPRCQTRVFIRGACEPCAIHFSDDMDRINFRLSPTLARALEARAERDCLPDGKPQPVSKIVRDAVQIHLDRLAIADVYGDRMAAVVDQQLQRLQALTDENARLQLLVHDLLARIEGGMEEPQPEPRAPDPREERLLENLIPNRKGARS